MQTLNVNYNKKQNDDTNLLNIFYINIRSLKNKLDEINLYLNKHGDQFFQIIIITGHG